MHAGNQGMQIKNDQGSRGRRRGWMLHSRVSSRCRGAGVWSSPGNARQAALRLIDAEYEHIMHFVYILSSLCGFTRGCLSLPSSLKKEKAIKIVIMKSDK